MAILKEDGSLDIERINELPYEEYMEEMGTLTEEQVNEYLSALPINESEEPVQPVVVDYTLEDERSGIDANDLLNKMKELRMNPNYKTPERIKVYPNVTTKPYYELVTWCRVNEKYDCRNEDDYREELQLSVGIEYYAYIHSFGIYDTFDRACQAMEEEYDIAYDNDYELPLCQIREKAMFTQMSSQHDYLQEWTFVHGLLHDRSIVPNYAERENPFHGRKPEDIHFHQGDIVQFLDGNSIYWGIVFSTPPTPEKVAKRRAKLRPKYRSKFPDLSESELEKAVSMDFSDDSYIILTNDSEYMSSHHHILSHHVFRLLAPVPDFIRKTLKKGIENALKEAN